MPGSQIEQYEAVGSDRDDDFRGRLQGPPSGRRRDVGNGMAVVGVLCGALSVTGSFLPWVVAYSGGDSPHVPVSGLADGRLGFLAILVAFALALGGLFAAMLVTPMRAALAVIPAVAGVVVCVVASGTAVPLDNGARATGAIAAGLITEVVAYTGALLASLVFALLERRACGGVGYSALPMRR